MDNDVYVCERCVKATVFPAFSARQWGITKNCCRARITSWPQRASERERERDIAEKLHYCLHPSGALQSFGLTIWQHRQIANLAGVAKWFLLSPKSFNFKDCNGEWLRQGTLWDFAITIIIGLFLNINEQTRSFLGRINRAPTRQVYAQSKYRQDI